MAEKVRSCMLVPAGGAGEGMGHLVRCLSLAEQLGTRVSILTRHLDPAARGLLAERLSTRTKVGQPVVISRIPAARHWDLVVVDARGIDARELAELAGHGLVVCLDEGGEARLFASFTIDTLPGLPGRAPANLSDPSYLVLPQRLRPSTPKSFRNIVLSLGGEDREHLGEKLAAAMIESGICDPRHLTAVEGPLAGERTWPAGVVVVRGPASIARLLSRHDLLITHFGMTAFEALAVGIPVVLFNPTRYHEKLGAAAGFPMIGTGTPRIAELRALLDDPPRLCAQVLLLNESLGQDRRRKLSRVLLRLKQTGSTACPACRTDNNRVIARFTDRTYRRCASCGVISLESFIGRRKYDDGYFSSEYKTQYGRTYLEDFQAIRSASAPRAAIVRGLLGRGGDGVVLDVGCAYGPFLAALDDAGLSGFGLDVSAGAVAHVKKELGFPALCAGFEEVERKRLPRRIAAVTMWYVLEHFPDIGPVLARAAGLLPPGGVFAFSTPNGRGISARRDMRTFLERSPADHFVILSPRGLRRILASFGLLLHRVRVTGHHPERFPGLLGRAAAKWAAAARVLRAVSVVLRLGDTFEAYAVRGDQ
jgi:2-polyprenyl-3-methyl-5-hydroxy-6-metoxy-1,4-benzoquinol methylase